MGSPRIAVHQLIDQHMPNINLLPSTTPRADSPLKFKKLSSWNLDPVREFRNAITQNPNLNSQTEFSHPGVSIFPVSRSRNREKLWFFFLLRKRAFYVKFLGSHRSQLSEPSVCNTGLYRSNKVFRSMCGAIMWKNYTI